MGRGRCSERLAGAEAYLPFLEALESVLHGAGGEAAARASRPAGIPSAGVSGGNSAIPTIRAAPHRGQTRDGLTGGSGTSGGTGSGAAGAGSAGGATAMPSNSRHRASLARRWRLAKNS